MVGSKKFLIAVEVAATAGVPAEFVLDVEAVRDALAATVPAAFAEGVSVVIQDDAELLPGEPEVQRKIAYDAYTGQEVWGGQREMDSHVITYNGVSAYLTWRCLDPDDMSQYVAAVWPMQDRDDPDAFDLRGLVEEVTVPEWFKLRHYFSEPSSEMLAVAWSIFLGNLDDMGFRTNHEWLPPGAMLGPGDQYATLCDDRIEWDPVPIMLWGSRVPANSLNYRR